MNINFILVLLLTIWIATTIASVIKLKIYNVTSFSSYLMTPFFVVFIILSNIYILFFSKSEGIDKISVHKKIYLMIYSSTKDLPIMLGILCNALKEWEQTCGERKKAMVEMSVARDYKVAFIKTVKSIELAV